VLEKLTSSWKAGFTLEKLVENRPSPFKGDLPGGFQKTRQRLGGAQAGTLQPPAGSH
jgi:hypothetical protein